MENRSFELAPSQINAFHIFNFKNHKNILCKTWQYIIIFFNYVNINNTKTKIQLIRLIYTHFNVHFHVNNISITRKKIFIIKDMLKHKT